MKLPFSESLNAVWVSTICLSLAVGMGQLVGLHIDRLYGSSVAFRALFWLRVGHIGLACVLIVVLMGFRSVLSKTRLLVLELFLFLPIFPITWFAQSNYAMTALPFAPLVAAKLLFLLIPVLRFGKMSINYLLFLALVAETLVFWHRFGLGRPELARLGEPLYTVAFVFIGLILFVIEVHEDRQNRRLLEARASASANSHIARVFLSARDKANSPLQTLRFGIDLLTRRGVAPEVVEPMRHSLEKLEVLAKEFKEFESHDSWAEISLKKKGFRRHVG